MVRTSHLYLKKHGIFMPIQIRDKFLELDDLIWKALGERVITERYSGVLLPSNVSIEALSKQGQPLLDALGAEIHNRLWAGALDRDAVTEKPSGDLDIVPASLPDVKPLKANT
jgi:hypothetical protein